MIDTSDMTDIVVNFMKNTCNLEFVGNDLLNPPYKL